MKPTELRKKIEEIFDNSPKAATLWYGWDADKVINQLLKLCQEYCDGVIGEDEREIEDKPDDNKVFVDQGFYIPAIERNQLRAELRQKNRRKGK